MRDIHGISGAGPTLAACVIAALAGGCGGVRSVDDAATDGGLDGDAAEPGDVRDDGEDASDGSGDDADAPQDADAVDVPADEDAAADGPPDAIEDVPVDDGEWLGPAGCGDGVREEPEVCDDGDRVTEECDAIGPRDCLSDCSGWMTMCGNGFVNLGEQCDDGDDDSMDGCTTSCTIDDGSIGSPCTCTGIECSTLDFTTGEIHGCDALADLADSSRIPACLRSVLDPTYGFAAYFPGGYCTLMAVGCTGLLCGDIHEVGDVDSFTCPEGYAPVTVEDTVFGTHVVSRTCHVVCDAVAQCRYGEREGADSPWSGCGRYSCLVRGDAGERVCMDERM